MPLYGCVSSLKKYEGLSGINSLDFVFLFIPVEAAFMLALQEEPALFHEAYNRHVVLVSPTTLMVTLRTVANIWRVPWLEKRTARFSDAEAITEDEAYVEFISLSRDGTKLVTTSDASGNPDAEGFTVTGDLWHLSTGRGNDAKLHPRAPRLAFDDACRLL